MDLKPIKRHLYKRLDYIQPGKPQQNAYVERTGMAVNSKIGMNPVAPRSKSANAAKCTKIEYRLFQTLNIAIARKSANNSKSRIDH